MTKYIIKLTDPEYSDYIYCIKDCIPPFGPQEFFSNDSVFDTIQEAEEHITAMLHSDWYRSDITRSNFEIVEVHQYKDLAFGYFYYTEKGYKQFKEN